MVNLLLVVNARRGFRLALLCLLDGSLFRTELLVLKFETGRFDVVRIVLLKLAGFNLSRFLQNIKRITMKNAEDYCLSCVRPRA